MTSTATLRRPAPPADPRLSELDLLDVSRLAEAVDAVVGPDLPVQRVRVEYLEYVPRSSLTVQLTAYVAGVALQGVVRTGAAADRAARATGTPLPGRDALLHWLPADPELPLLAWPTTRLRRLLGDRPRTGETPTVLAYVPGRRATLLLSPYVLKTYATAEDHANAVAGGLLLATGAALRTPRLLASLPGHRVTVQEQLEGVPAASAQDPLVVAERAGGLLRRLHDAHAVPAVRRDATDVVADACAAVEVLGTVLPVERRRAESLLRRLGSTAPTLLPLVPSHGDFTLDQLLLTPSGDLVVTDVDEAGLAPEALDVATYAANLVSGRPGDDDRAGEALDALVAAHGEPPALRWFLAVALLRRCDRPFRRLKKDWPAKCAAVLDLAEKVTTSCA